MSAFGDEDTFRIVQTFIMIAFVLHRAYYTRKYPPAEGETLEEQTPTALSRLANLLFLPGLLGLFVYLINPAWMAWSALPLPVWARWLGVLLAAEGFGLLQGSHRALGRNWSDQPRVTAAQTLTTSGPYRWIRHPIYTAFLLILGSALLITTNWFAGLFLVAGTALDIRERVVFEDAHLRARFGEPYADYFRRTGSLLPRFWKGVAK